MIYLYYYYIGIPCTYMYIFYLYIINIADCVGGHDIISKNFKSLFAVTGFVIKIVSSVKIPKTLSKKDV